MGELKWLVYLVGEPGVGKSTTMAAATARWMRVRVEGRGDPRRWPTRQWFFERPAESQPVAVELGDRRPAFSGTDALPMDAITGAVRYLAAEPEAPVLLGEGARLGVLRFLAAAVEHEWRTHLILLESDQAGARRAARGSRQDPAWIAGAATRARNLHANAPQGVTRHRWAAEEAVSRLGLLLAALA